MAKLNTKDIYQHIVDKFIEQLKDGKNPFVAVGEVKNISTDRHYTGFNRWHLGGVVNEQNYTSGSFATYKQIIAAGGQVKKGEKSLPVFFWGTMYFFKGDIVVSASSQADALKFAKKKKSSITLADFIRKTMFIKHFSVFNMDQQEGAEFNDIQEELDDPFTQLISSSEAKVAEGIMPHYFDEIDTLAIPDAIDENNTTPLLKALIKTTGHESRLGRDFEYAEEELIATIGASFLSSVTKTEKIEHDITITQSWLDMLGEKPMFLYKASTQAQKACDMLLDKVALYNSISIAKSA